MAHDHAHHSVASSPLNTLRHGIMELPSLPLIPSIMALNELQAIMLLGTFQVSLCRFCLILKLDLHELTHFACLIADTLSFHGEKTRTTKKG